MILEKIDGHTFLDFDSLADLNANWKTDSESDHDKPGWTDPDYRGSEIRRMLAGGGNPDAARIAAKLSESIDVPDVQSSVPEPMLSVVGGAVSVPAYLSGSPANMITMIDRVKDRCPVKIIVQLSASCGFSGEDMKKRCAAIMALASQLRRIRPVDVSTVFTCDRSYNGKSITIYVPAGRVAAIESIGLMVGTPGFHRHVMFHNFRANFPESPPSMPFGTCREFEAGPLRTRYGFKPEADIYVGSASSKDDSDMVRNPQAWVERKIRQYSVA